MTCSDFLMSSANPLQCVLQTLSALQKWLQFGRSAMQHPAALRVVAHQFIVITVLLPAGDTCVKYLSAEETGHCCSQVCYACEH